MGLIGVEWGRVGVSVLVGVLERAFMGAEVGLSGVSGGQWGEGGG